MIEDTTKKVKDLTINDFKRLLEELHNKYNFEYDFLYAIYDELYSLYKDNLTVYDVIMMCQELVLNSLTNGNEI